MWFQKHAVDEIKCNVINITWTHKYAATIERSYQRKNEGQRDMDIGK